MYILGISCFYHDAAACLVKDGKVVAAAQEERFSRIKHDWSLPREAISSCLDIAGISIEAVEAVAFYEKPLVKFERVLENFISTVPRGFRSFIDIIPSWLAQKLLLPTLLKKEVGYKGPVLYCDHHLAHAASSYFLSPFETAAVLTVDGVGEWATATWGEGCGSNLQLTDELRFPHSLGLLYSAFTAYLGFEVNDGEYKVMGMAPYGIPAYADLIKQELVAIAADGSIRLNMEYFVFQYGRRMVNSRFEQLFGLPARQPDSEISQKHYNVAASIQTVLEEALLAMARNVHAQTGQKKLCIAGGVALNCVANSRILREGPFDDVFIQPAAGDAGAAVGAALLAWHSHFGKEERYGLDDVYWGPSFSDMEAEDALRGHSSCLSWRHVQQADLIAEAVRYLDGGKVIGWFQGRMEFGPRALGNRSILADPRSDLMKDTVNGAVKYRELFRPFAPAVTWEERDRFFDMQGESPYMLLTTRVKSEEIPAVTHVDGSARVQTVRSEQNPLFHLLLHEFGQRTGVPVLLNTSFNLRGEPIVCSPADAVDTFLRCGLDLLCIGNLLVTKKGMR